MCFCLSVSLTNSCCDSGVVNPFVLFLAHREIFSTVFIIITEVYIKRHFKEVQIKMGNMTRWLTSSVDFFIQGLCHRKSAVFSRIAQTLELPISYIYATATALVKATIISLVLLLGQSSPWIGLPISLSFQSEFILSIAARIIPLRWKWDLKIPYGFLENKLRSLQ